jgi:hypothetical protein
MIVAVGGTQANSSSPTTVVKNWLEEDYVVRPGDTYVSISQAKFGTEKYAQALEQYNRAHPRLEAELKRKGLVPGVTIAVPAAKILDEGYGGAVSEPGKGTTAAPSVTNHGTGQPGPSTGPGKVVATGTGAVGRSARYVVKTDGESMRAIAAVTLNGRDRWGEIADLNPNVDPAFPIRVGTVLNLPPDARVPSANVPQ